MIDFTAWSGLVGVIGWCLVHFVWQAALVAAGYAAARTLVPRGNARYLAAMAALVVLAALPVATGIHELHALAAVSAAPGSVVAAAGPAALGTPAAPGWQAALDAAMPWLVLAWAITASLLGARVVRQWLRLRAVVAAATILPEWQMRARRLGARVGVHRIVPILASVRIATPTLVGWLRPAVVLPLTVLTRMPPAQIDLVLAHELAHLKRFDHFANLFQVVLETLFFYHPAVRWISRDARNEREVCCDALALRATGGARRDFIEALASLAELGTGRGVLTLAADGGVLVERAAFIAGVAPSPRRRSLAGGLGVALAVATLVFGVAAWWHHAVLQSARLQAIASTSAAALTRSVVAGLVDAAAAPALAPAIGLRLAPLPRVVAAHAATAPAPAVPVARVALDAPIAAPLQVPARIQPVLAPVPVPVSDAPASAVPTPVHTVAPVYPPRAMVQGVQGEVVIEFGLSPGGVPQNLRVVRSGTGPLDAAALQALSEWRFASGPGDAGHTYRQSFAFRLGSGANAAGACLVMTGTHVCRDVAGIPADARSAGARHP